MKRVSGEQLLADHQTKGSRGAKLTSYLGEMEGK